MTIARERHSHNIVLGAGELYLAELGADGTPLGERYLGDSIGATLTTQGEQVAVQGGDGADRDLAVVVRGRRVQMRIVLHDMSIANVALALSSALEGIPQFRRLVTTAGSIVTSDGSDWAVRADFAPVLRVYPYTPDETRLEVYGRLWDRWSKTGRETGTLDEWERVVIFLGDGSVFRDQYRTEASAGDWFVAAAGVTRGPGAGDAFGLELPDTEDVPVRHVVWIVRTALGDVALRGFERTSPSPLVVGIDANGNNSAKVLEWARLVEPEAERLGARGGMPATIEQWVETNRNSAVEDFAEAETAVFNAAHRHIRGALRYIETDAPGAGRVAGRRDVARRSVYLHRADLGPSGALDLKSRSSEQQVTLTATAVRGPGGRLMTISED